MLSNLKEAKVGLIKKEEFYRSKYKEIYKNLKPVLGEVWRAKSLQNLDNEMMIFLNTIKQETTDTLVLIKVRSINKFFV